jgi:hypothetical protein
MALKFGPASECEAGWQPAADLQSACTLANHSTSAIDNRAQDNILPHILSIQICGLQN